MRRVEQLRQRVRAAMEEPPVKFDCPARIDARFMSEALAVRKARAIELKLSVLPLDLWDGQLIAGSMTLENPRVHAERGFPKYITDAEEAAADKLGLSMWYVFGHIVPDYSSLLAKGLMGIRADVEAECANAKDAGELAFLDSVIISLDAVMAYADRLAAHCDAQARTQTDPLRASELRQMAANLRQVPAGPAQTFWQALQSVWTLHMCFHSTLDALAVGRLDQFVWPYLKADLDAGRIDMDSAAELVDCFCLKFNERAKTTEDQRPDRRSPEELDFNRKSRHYTSSQIWTTRDSIDATNHWLQNIIVGGVTPEGTDATNPLTFLLLESCRRNKMTNPVLTVRFHKGSPDELVRYTCEVLKDGGGMPAIFNDEELIGSLERIGIPTEDARDYTNDGCWEIIIPGRTDFGFLRLSTMLCLEWALNGGRTRVTGRMAGLDTGDARALASYDQLWQAFLTQLDGLIGRTVERIARAIDERSTIAPVPLLSALIDGAVSSRRDMTAGGAKFRLFSMLLEGAAHTIDSLVAIKKVIFEEKRADMSALCDALDANFEGYTELRSRLSDAPKYGNDDDEADSVGRELIDAFTSIVARHAEAHAPHVRFPAGVGTFSWFIGIGEGLGASPDGRLSGEPVSSNFSPALARDVEGLPGAILSYAKMHNCNLPAGSPLDLRLMRKLVEGDEGTSRMAALIRGFVDTGGSMMTLTVADTEELRAAQREPENYKSLRVRVGGWCAYFTMLSGEQQKHHIRRQEGRS